MQLNKLVFLAALAASSLLANQRYNNYCQQGGKTVITSGVSGAPKVQASYPQCQVRVYNSGTVTLATLYSDNIGTPKPNPFTANTDGSYYFYAANGRYDVTMSAGGLPAPVTIGDVLLADPFSSSVVFGSALVAANFAFQARPVGNLSAGSTTVTFSPVPSGLNGSDSFHWLWATGGTPEACLVNGGSGISNAPSGTISVSCAHAHAGATLSSATSGVQEAVQYIATSFPNPWNGTISVGGITGVQILYAPVTIAPPVQVTIIGSSIQTNTVMRDGSFTWDHMFKVMNGASAFFQDMQIIAGFAIVTGNYTGIWSNGGLHTSRIIISLSGGMNGILSDSAGTTVLDHTYIQSGDSTHPSNYGIKFDCSIGGPGADNVNVFLLDVVVAAYGNPQLARGLDITCGDGFQITNSDLQGQVGMILDPGDGKHVYNVLASNVFIDLVSNEGVVFATAGSGTIKHVIWSGGEINCEGTGLVGLDFGSLFGAPNLDYALFTGTHIAQCKNSGVIIPNITAFTNPSISLVGATIADNGLAPTSPGVLIANGAHGFKLIGNKIGSAVNATFPATQQNAIFFSGTANGIISGNDLCGNVSTALASTGGQLSGIIQGNLCFNDGVPFSALANLSGLPLGTVLYVTDANATCNAGGGTGRNCQKVAAGWAN